MNKAIRKNLFVSVLLGAILFLLIGVATVSNSTMTAHAAGRTTPKYLVHFAYTATRSSNTSTTTTGVRRIRQVVADR